MSIFDALAIEGWLLDLVLVYLLGLLLYLGRVTVRWWPLSAQRRF